MNGKVILLLVGLLVGAAVGWFTKPPAVSLQLGPLNIEIASNQSPAGSPDGLTREQRYHIGLLAAVGGLIGLGLGVALDRRS